MGYKPIYATESVAKQISYSPLPQKVVQNTGNIYAYQNYIFQIEPGIGIHVIDNTSPASASRVGFINVNGCTQISIKDGYIYINNYDDMVVLKFSANQVTEESRLKGVFPELRFSSPIAQPPLNGYYECIREQSVEQFVVGWKPDSVSMCCYKY